ncbi:MAG: DUF2520 domain-containing protein [Bacteroidales bacterium]|nr:DUF2520 domain-containing protein [Bacteroidales bacterium]
MADAKIRIGIIGAGNVGTHFARLFLNAGVEVFLCTSEGKAEFLSGFSEEKIVSDPNMLPNDLDLVFFTRRDRDLQAVTNVLDKNNTLVHCSGSMEMNLLSSFNHYGVFYPLQTFRKEQELIHTNFPVFIEASDEETEAFLMNLASLITPNVHKADLALRRRLHLAGVLSSNFVNYLYAAAYEQVDDKFDADEVLLPLMKETLSRLNHGHPDEFQTGPAIRKDEETIEKHLQMLENHPELQELYRSLSEIIKKRHS